jgi:phage protein D
MGGSAQGWASPHLRPDEVKSECEQKKRLLGEYEAATASFSSAVSELRRRMGASPKEEYKRLAQISNDARVKSEGARLALGQYIFAHGC